MQESKQKELLVLEVHGKSIQVQPRTTLLSIAASLEKDFVYPILGAKYNGN